MADRSIVSGPMPDERRHYRAWIVRHGRPEGGNLLHLIRDGAEASLCGLPRSTLTSGGILDDQICEECINWLPRLNSGKSSADR